ncbi:MAG: AAA family ATPase [Dokdonella sp.]|uniref:AAA family ATPase n=1 Tax=Dokdonella sp. TaxID=2291710 RepID=UPI0025BE18E9|nr:AAA family ATPase [Dokdonella sp.]MBZ0224291.1 AAA family ATPase [Dokdonella sp.]MCC7255608.1 AAA family ATPase [Dokdonella sp.]
MLALQGRALAAALSPSERYATAEFLGIELPPSIKDGELIDAMVTAAGKRRDAVVAEPDRPCALQENLNLLQRKLDLSPIDLDVIAFRALLRVHDGFEELAGAYIKLCPDYVFYSRLAAVLDSSPDAIAHALHRRGKLVGTGLMDVPIGIAGPLAARLTLYRGLESSLFLHHRSTDALFGALLPPSRKARLDLEDYRHLIDEVRLLRSYLGRALRSEELGGNVLLYGDPGSGKTELAAALAASLQCALYPVSSRNEYGRQTTPRDRLTLIGQTQKLVHLAGNGVVLVDEAEDLFPTVWSDPEKIPTKIAVNECLETNPTPTIWISNRVKHIDEAFLRRFDLVIHVAPLPAKAKGVLLNSELPAATLEDAELRAYASCRQLTPAVLNRMARVAHCSPVDSPADVRRNLRILSSHYLETLGVRPMPNFGAAPQLKHDLALLNTDVPLQPVIAGLQHSRNGARMLLHGLPGTGKTAFGMALAEQIDRPLLQRQASALLSCFVGETEKNLRDLFDEARRDGSVLLLDEADSFLRSREGARARWEVTQTNELLTQMEAFDGIFLCTTNRLDDLDTAALRRFDFKVKFEPLRLDQRIRLIGDCCSVLGLQQVNDGELRLRARRLDGLTPGDAAAVLRRLQIIEDTTTREALLDALADECRYKPNASRPMGFVQ